jgi:hypothetical protein
MARVFKPWTPATAELELLHECWLARLPPARIAARLGISEPKLNRFMRRVHSARAMPRPEPAKPRQLRHQASSSGADGLFARMFGTTFRDILSSRQIALIGLPCTKNARRIFAIISTISIPTSAAWKPLWTLSPGVPIGCRLPRKRGPYSMPIHIPTRRNIDEGRFVAAGLLAQIKNRPVTLAQLETC